jgi:hypothetical protein
VNNNLVSCLLAVFHFFSKDLQKTDELNFVGSKDLFGPKNFENSKRYAITEKLSYIMAARKSWQVKS